MAEKYWLQLADGKTHPYLVVNSKRAKYIRIKLSNTGELSVVLPRRASITHAHDFVQNKLGWVEKHLEQIPLVPVNPLPEFLDLKLLGECWSLEYENYESEYLTLIEKNDFILQITGNTEDSSLVKKVINQWCKKKSKMVFPGMLEELAEKHGFHYNRLSIRSQKTRWGSCSAQKNISLNSKLLLMPENVVRYVIIHELCHTIEMNHSHRFWSLVEDCDADFLLNRKQLKTLGKTIII